MNIIEQMLNRYDLKPNQDNEHALREIMQEIALAGLQRAGFFNKAAFYGGTCLRIFYNLPRFSEDLDFSLLEEDQTFSLEPYFNSIKQEFIALGFDVEISQRNKIHQTAIVSAFLKKNTSIYDIKVAGHKTLKIKFEVDTNPPMLFHTEEKLLLQPFSFYTKCFTLEDLYAGKMHALLFRKWKNRVKGRDWFDFEWYVRQNAKLNLEHFSERARQSGDWNKDNLSQQDFLDLLLKRIDSVDFGQAKQDVAPFIRDLNVLDIWSNHYFKELARQMKFVST